MKVWDVAGALCVRVLGMFLDVLFCRTAEIPFYVGEVLQWRRCNCVRRSVFLLCIMVLTPEKIRSRLRRCEHYLSEECHLLTSTLQKDKFNTSSFELHQLLSQPTLTGVPLLVVSNLFRIQPTLSSFYSARQQERPLRKCFCQRPYQNSVRHLFIFRPFLSLIRST